jgi:glutamate-ammonia-ligase adenylyltransferase
MEISAEKAIVSLPENLRPAVVLWLERLAERGVAFPDDSIEPVVRLVASSEFAGKILLRDASWFVENTAAFSRVLDDELEEFVEALSTSVADLATVKSDLRRFRNRALVRILFRDLTQQADLDETLRQLSLLADRLLDAATRYAERHLQPRFGRVRNADGDAIPLVILGMGKLGGRELNFSSDIDLIFCYSEDGDTDGERTLSAQEYFARLSRQIIALIDEVTVDGFVFRIDTRLRPFGESGPPVVSFAALEAYLLQHGRDWERYAYVKARIVGSQPSVEIVEELQEGLIRPFVYRRYIDYGVFESVREMQQMIAAEVRRRDLAENVKLGPGGIREAEFIVQALQLVRGGSEPTLQCRELQVVLPKLVSARGISADDARTIRVGYRYLRRVENFIQAIRDEQTHDLPSTDIDRDRLCLAMNCDSWADLVGQIDEHRNAISAQFDAVAARGQGGESPKSGAFDRLWASRANAEAWEDVLSGPDATSLAESMAAFGSSSLTQKIDSVSDERLQRFVPKMLELVIDSERPVSALSRTLAVTERILRRSAYLALLNENQQAMSRLVDLCARSQYIAGQIARYPVLLDELLDPRVYSDGVTREDIADELRQRLEDEASEDSEAQMQTIAQFQRAAMFRIAVADFNDRLPIMKVSDGLTWLAEVILDEALRVAWSDLTARHGTPHYVLDGIEHEAGFGIVAYGKLGGLELSYGSDLDIVFLHDSSGEQQQTDGEKPLDNSMFYARLVRRLVHLLTTQTGSGELYEVDTRLRPDGRSGLLVTNTEAFERYQEENAWTWEHQALLRARAVAGSDKVAAEFERIRRETLANRVRRETLRDDVVNMRLRMRKELDRSHKVQFDLKHGEGGLGDIEFLVQYLVLREAGAHPDVTHYSDNIRQLDALVTARVLKEHVGTRLQDIYRCYRLRLHRLVLDGQNALCDANEFVIEREFVASVWQEWLG